MFNLLKKKTVVEKKPVESLADAKKKLEYEIEFLKGQTTILGLGESFEYHHRLCMAIHRGLQLNCFVQGDSRHLELINLRTDFLNKEAGRLMQLPEDF